MTSLAVDKGLQAPGTRRVPELPQSLRLYLADTLPGDFEILSNFLEGTVGVGGLVEEAPCRGTLDFLYFTEGKIRYTFDFKGKQGRPYRYVGEKVDIRPWNLPRTHTTCYGTISDLDSGREISRSIVYFRMGSIPAFLQSFRLT